MSVRQHINGSFEEDENGDGLPDFWDIVWRNGNSANPYAGLSSYEQVHGQYEYRLYSGSGDAGSYQYVRSRELPVEPSTAYELRALMKYTVADGGRAEMTMIQVDGNGNHNGEESRTFTHGGWQFHDNGLPFITNWNTKSVILRFGVGGEEGAYLHLDDVRLIR